jgi:enamine deaminase RidA (YjgF/YER057c/UK114 family)
MDQRVADSEERRRRIMPRKKSSRWSWRRRTEPVSRDALWRPRLRGGPDRAASGHRQLGGDIREQTRNVLERIKKVLEAAGTSLDNVLTVTTHLTNRDNLAAYNEEYAKYFPTNNPARTTVTAILNAPELLVEITVTACMPE